MGRHRQISNEQILSTARACFLSDGPAVSTAAIASCLGVSQAALFKRFATKEALMIAALAPPEDPTWIAVAQSGPDNRDVREQLTEIGRNLDHHLKEMIPRIAVLRSSGIRFEDLFGRHREPPPKRGHSILTQWFRTAIDRGLIREEDPSALAMMFFGALQFRPFLAHLTGSGSDHATPDRYVRFVVDTLLRGILPDEEGDEA